MIEYKGRFLTHQNISQGEFSVIKDDCEQISDNMYYWKTKDKIVFVNMDKRF